MENQVTNESKVGAVLVLVAFMFGINPIVIKLGITEVSPMIFTTARLFVAVLAFTFFLIRSKTWRRVNARDALVYTKMGACAFVFQLGMILSLKYVSAAIVATMIGLMPISTLIIHRVKGSRTIMNFHYLGTAVTFIGVLLVSGVMAGSMKGDVGDTLIGISLLLVAQFVAAIYMVLSEEMLETYSHYQVSASMFFVAFVFFFIATIPEVVTQGIEDFSLSAIICVVYGGVVSLCIANNLWIWGIKKIGSHKTAIFNNLPPVFALAVGMLVLNEFPISSQVIGVVTILIGLYVFSGKWAQEKPDLWYDK